MVTAPELFASEVIDEITVRPERNRQVEANKRYREKMATVVRRPCADPERRARLEKKPEKWLKHYLPGAFPLPFGQVHKDIIKSAKRTIETGSGVCCAAPRGTGKTTVLWGMVLWAALTGRVIYPLFGAFKKTASDEALTGWLDMLSCNELIQADYPEFTQPFEEAQHANRLRRLVWADEEGNLKPCAADIMLGKGTIILPDGRGILGAFSIGGSTRGLHVQLKDGTRRRPDCLLLDDPQDRETAMSPSMTEKMIKKIDGDLLSLAGPDTRMSVMMAVTVITDDDVSTHYLNHPDYEPIRVAQIVTWPGDWVETESETKALWNVWNQERVDGLEQRDGGKRARAFYRANKPALTLGMRVSWRHRRDKKRREPDAMFNAMWDFYRLGSAAFMAERQNEPERPETALYVLTAGQVLSHTVARPAFELPSQARVLGGFTDINRSGLHWCVAAFDQHMSSHVTAYGKYPERGDLWPENAPELVRKKAIFAGLKALCDRLKDMPFVKDGKRVHLGTFLIDRGYEPGEVHRFADQASYPFQVIASKGFAASKYFIRKSTLVGKPFEQVHVTETHMGQFAAHNTDYWREIAQRAFLGEVGGPGSATLFGGDPHRHQRFADHIVSERLKNKYETDSGMRWEWGKVVGVNDLLDAWVGCFVAAAMCGLVTSGEVKVAKTQAARPRARVRMGKIR